MPPVAVVEFDEDNFRVYEFISVSNGQFENAWEKVFEIRFTTPNQQGIIGVLSEVVGTQLAKEFTVDTVLLFGTVATRAGVRVITKRVRRECPVQGLYGVTKLDRFVHTSFYARNGGEEALKAIDRSSNTRANLNSHVRKSLKP